MTTVRFMLLFALLLVISVPALCADLPKITVDDYWMGVYYGDTRIGFVHTVIKQGTFEGKPVLTRQDDLTLRIKSDGKPLEYKLSHTLYSGADYIPVADIFTVNDPLEKTNSKMEMRYAGDSVKVTAIEGDAEPKSMNAPLDEDDRKKLIASCKYSLGASELKAGGKFKATLLAMDNISFTGGGFSWNVTNCELEVLREEEVSCLGKTVKSLVVKQTQDGDEATAWCSASGQTYKVKHEQRDIAFVREAMADAKNVPEGAGPNISNAKGESSAQNDVSKLPVAQSRDLSNIPQDYWMGIYCENKRIGYAHVVVKKDTYENKEVLCKLEDRRFRYRTAEKFYDDEIKQTLYVGNDFLPVAQFISVINHPGDEPKQVLALHCDGKTLDMNMSFGESKPVQSSGPIDKETRDLYTSAAIYDLGLAKLNIGGKFGVWHWTVGLPDANDSKSQLHFNSEEPEIEVLREEALPDGKKGYVVTEKTKDAVLTKWFDESGQLYKQQSDKSSITLVREPREKVLEIEKGDIPVIGKPAQVASREYWMGVYYGDTKIGYLHTKVGPNKYQGRDVILRQDLLKFRYTRKGTPIKAEINRGLFSDEFFRPIVESVTASSSESKQYDMFMQLEYNEDGMAATMKSGEESSRRDDIPYHEGEKDWAFAGTWYSFLPNQFVVGDKTYAKHFVVHGLCIKDSRIYMGIHIDDCELEALRKEALKVGDTEYQTVVVAETYQGDMTTSYFAENGEEVKRMDRLNNISFIREDKEKATEIDKGDGPDIDKLVKQ